MKKRLFALVSAVLALMMVAGCSGAGSSEGTVDADGNWVWERKVEIVCPWGVGGGADATIRPMADLLTKKLGVQVSVNNIEGARRCQPVWSMFTSSPLTAIPICWVPSP